MDSNPWFDTSHDRIQIRTLDNKSPFADLAQDVRSGLGGSPKQLPPKYFYDEYGSELFDRICRTPEYYPTRTEDALLAQYAEAIVSEVRPDVIVELGSGASRKTDRLLRACDALGRHAMYQPVDICGEMLLSAGHRLVKRYHWLQVEGVVADYCGGLDGVARTAPTRLFVFLGGTLGNFSELEARSFLSELRGTMSPGDWFLLGVDRVKDPAVLNAAYNDVEGITAAFNLNVLSVINRELEANFSLDRFEHHAWFNEEASRIEMHLRARERQRVEIPGLDLQVGFEAGESILTEISRKFTLDSLQALLTVSGFELATHFQPENQYFSLVLARPSESS